VGGGPGTKRGGGGGGTRVAPRPSSLSVSEKVVSEGGLEKVRRGNSSPGCGRDSSGCLEAVSSSQRVTEVILTPGWPHPRA
jgi:hypothetical protein